MTGGEVGNVSNVDGDLAGADESEVVGGIV